MADYNKVLKGYEQCIKSGYLGGAFCNRNTCPYNQCEAKCVSTLINDVDAMLKEQDKKGTWRDYEGLLKCSVCGAEFYKEIMEYCGDKVPHFCPDCGAEMVGV